MILDIHTHHAFPQPQGVINLRMKSLDDLDAIKECVAMHPEQSYSIGIHPWDISTTEGLNNPSLARIEEVAMANNVVAIGESGVDPNGAAPFFQQMLIFKSMIEISEKLGKPLILHAVKSDDVICGLRRDLKPRMNWMVHGYRGKPQGALQLVKSGCMIGFGEKFNADTLRALPLDKILAETDESELTIEEILAKLSDAREVDLLPIIAENSAKFLNFGRLSSCYKLMNR